MLQPREGAAPPAGSDQALTHCWPCWEMGHAPAAGDGASRVGVLLQQETLRQGERKGRCQPRTAGNVMEGSGAPPSCTGGANALGAMGETQFPAMQEISHRPSGSAPLAGMLPWRSFPAQGSHHSTGQPCCCSFPRSAEFTLLLVSFNPCGAEAITDTIAAAIPRWVRNPQQLPLPCRRWGSELLGARQRSGSAS